MKKILCLCLSSTIQRTISFKNVSLEKVNRSEYYIENASGKAINTARVLNQLEKNCAHIICPLGKNNSAYFTKLAQNDELTLDFVEIEGNTRICWTLLDKTLNTTTELVISEPEASDLERAEIKILKRLNDIICDYDAVLLSGSRPKGWNNDLYPTICGITKDNNKFFLADFTGNDLISTIKTAIPDVIKINDEEFEKTFNEGQTLDENQLKSLICTKSKELQNMIIITRGNKSTYSAKNGCFYECESEVINPVNTTACGDSFNAGFIYEYLSSGDFKCALEKGTWCAARNAESEIPGSILK